jgi:hypothetical protein
MVVMMTDDDDSRKDQDRPSEPRETITVPGGEKLVQPPAGAPAITSALPIKLRIGFLTGIAVATLLLFQLALIGHRTSPTDGWTLVWLADIWATWAISIWVLVQQPISLRRATVLGVSLAWHCMLLAVNQSQPPERYLVMLGCYGLLQSVACVLFGLPAWRIGSGGIRRPGQPPQFGILSLSAITAGVALVMWGTRRYRESASDGFLPGTMAVMAALLFVAMVAMLASVMERQRWVGPPAVLAAAMIAAFAMVVAESVAVRGDTPPIPDSEGLWTLYAVTDGLFGGIVYLFGVCGRGDAKVAAIRGARLRN